MNGHKPLGSIPIAPLQRGLGWFDAVLLTAFAALLFLAAILGFWQGSRQANGPRADSAEAGFARDMMTHHAQAVDMATLIRDRSDDPEIRQLALDILLTQQGQIGQMEGWLTLWNLPIASTDPAMAWMGMPTTGSLPGMATPDQINQLRTLTGLPAEVMFLNLMIPHHVAGVEMARAILERTQHAQVRALAESIVAAQENEIIVMQALLKKKGATLIAAPTGMPGMGPGTPMP